MRHIKHYLYGQALDNYNMKSQLYDIYNKLNTEYVRLYEDDNYLIVKSDDKTYYLYDRLQPCLASNEYDILHDEMTIRKNKSRQLTLFDVGDIT